MTNSKEFLRRNVLILLYLVSLESGIQLGVIWDKLEMCHNEVTWDS